MALFVTRFNKQQKFQPVVRLDQRDNESIEVRFEGYDIVGVSLSREQYAQFRDAVGKFKPNAAPVPAPAPHPSDDWSS